MPLKSSISSHVRISYRFYEFVTTRYTTDFYIIKCDPLRLNNIIQVLPRSINTETHITKQMHNLTISGISTPFATPDRFLTSDVKTNTANTIGSQVSSLNSL